MPTAIKGRISNSWGITDIHKDKININSLLFAEIEQKAKSDHVCNFDDKLHTVKTSKLMQNPWFH
jgi:hypothetical protein